MTHSPVGELGEAHNLKFHGTASSFFRICLVNGFLSLITLGIFLPWALISMFFSSCMVKPPSVQNVISAVRRPLAVHSGDGLFMVFSVDDGFQRFSSGCGAKGDGQEVLSENLPGIENRCE